MQILSFLRLENIFEEVRHEALRIAPFLPFIGGITPGPPRGAHRRPIDQAHGVQEIHEGGLDLTLSFEGEKIWSQPMIWASKCGNAFVKIGIARPGSKQVLEKSIFDIDYLKIKEKN